MTSIAKDYDAGGGISFLGALFLLFLGLKLTGAIDWSWWWVTSPLWLPVAVVLVILVIMILVGVIGGLGKDE